MVNKLASLVLDGLFPFQCELCQLPCGRALPLCDACEKLLPHNQSPCPLCALPLHGGQLICGLCLQRAPTYRRCRAPLLYKDEVSGFVQRLKYQRDMSMVPLLGTQMIPLILQSLSQGPRPDYLLPMPLHWRRLWARGYNQSERLAHYLARHPTLKSWKLRVDRRLCHRNRETAPQQGLDRADRQRNLLGAFTASPRVEGMYIAVVDDVMTTGASAEFLAQALVDTGARRVDIWCCARTQRPEPARVPTAVQ